jgi:triacylglycerol lipase
MNSRKHVFLVPGFFGFVNLGGMYYFAHVAEFLGGALRELGIDADVYCVPTHPTGSIRQRAADLLDAILHTEARERGDIILVGHSTGGLDARLLVTPNVALPTSAAPETVASRIRAVVTVSTPHHGTPLSSLFSGPFGRKLLRVLSLSTIYGIRFGHLPLSVVFKLGALLARVDDRFGLSDSIADQIFAQLLSDFSADRRREVRQFLEGASLDQALVAQLTPEGADVFNAGTNDRAGVKYGSVISLVPKPGLKSVRRVGVDPYAQATHALFQLLYRSCSGSKQPHVPPVSDEQRRALRRWLGNEPDPRDSDGIVPALSQVWGEVIFAGHGDHHDVIGNFGDSRHDPPHYDWLTSGSGFNRRRFEALWTAIARFVSS